MRFFYMDASALAKRYSPEIGTPLLDHLFAHVTMDRLCVLNVGIGEVLSLLVRKRNAGVLAPTTYVQGVAHFRAEIVASTSLRKIVAGNALVDAALPLIETHSLNATDAVILRSALNIAAQLRTAGNDLVLIASDQRLLRAAQAEGLTTFNPETQTQADLDALL